MAVQTARLHRHTAFRSATVSDEWNVGIRGWLMQLDYERKMVRYFMDAGACSVLYQEQRFHTIKRHPGGHFLTVHYLYGLPVDIT
jgi:hypothetical protein